MTQRLDKLQAALEAALGDKIKTFQRERGEITLTVTAANYLAVATRLRDDPTLKFEQLIDLCGVDYSDYRQAVREGSRYCVVLHLLSLSLNQRVRVKVFAPDDDFPVVDSVNAIWNAANWFEREAFDLYGIVFEGHEDLRRILTDYGFIGHPFRKDFPLIGNVEVRYDAEKKRVVYEPVTSVVPRVLVPRTIRDDSRYEQAQAESKAGGAK